MILKSNDWKKYKLNELATRITKGTTPSTVGGKFLNTGINYIKSEAVNYNGRIDTSTFVYIDKETHEKLKRSQLEEDDILFSIAGIFLGKTGLVTKSILPANTNQAVAIIRLNKSLANPKFIHFFLRNTETVRFVNSMSSQSAQPNINLEEVGSLEVNLPPLSEQTAIAEILSALDDKIELNLQTNKTLEDMANALYKHWFVDFGPFKNGKFIESELGLIPEIMKVKDLGEIVEINTKSVKPFENPLIGYYHFSIPSYDAGRTANLEYGSTIASNKTLIYKSSILVSKLNPRIKRVWTVFPHVKIECISSTEFINYLPKKEDYWGYLNCLLRTDWFFEEMIKGSTGTSNSHQRAQPKETLKFKIIKGSESEMGKFNSIIMPYFELIDKNYVEINSLKQTRDYLLPKLISGEIRVKEASKKVQDLV